MLEARLMKMWLKTDGLRARRRSALDVMRHMVSGVSAIETKSRSAVKAYAGSKAVHVFVKCFIEKRYPVSILTRETRVTE